MYVKEVTVKTEVGLYARVATYFIQKANEFKSSIWLEKDDRRVNAKSLLGVLSLGVGGGATIKIIADGEDESQSVDALVSLIENGFTLPDPNEEIYKEPAVSNSEANYNSQENSI